MSGSGSNSIESKSELARRFESVFPPDPRGNPQRFREMMDAMPVAVYTTDAAGMITQFNSACVEFCGRSLELGRERWCITAKLFYPDGRPMPLDESPMAVALREGRAVRGVEAIAERPDGTRIWFQPHPTPLFDEAGVLVGGINVLVDITERKQADAAKAHLAAIVESSEDAIATKDLSGTITSWNAGAERLFGYTAQEAVGQPVTMLMPPDRVNEEPGILERIRNGERVDHYETVRRRKDGTLLHISLTVSPIRDAQGRIIGASKVARDITRRTQAEQALRDHARILEVLNQVGLTLSAKLDTEKVVQAVTDAATEVSRAKFGAFFFNTVNDQGEAYLLYTLSGAPREAFEKFGLPRNTPVFAPTFSGHGVVRSDDITKDPRYGQMGPHHGMPEGHLPVRSYLAVPVVSGSGAVLGGLFFGHPDAGVFTEQAERLVSGIATQAAIAIDNARLYEEARESEGRFRAMAENIPQLAWMARPDGHIYWYNRRWYEFTGTNAESQEGWGWQSAHHPEYVEAVIAKWSAALRAGEPWEDTFPLRDQHGRYHWFLSRAYPIRDEQGAITRWFGTNTDITAQREAEEALRRHQQTLEETVRQRTEEATQAQRALAASERMASLGTLAAGLGHDIGNLLVPIRVRMESLQARHLPADAVEELSEIQSGVSYLQKLASGLRLLAIDPTLAANAEPTELRSWWPEVSSVLTSALPRGITLKPVLPEAECWVTMQPAAIMQAVFNLVQNAGEAMRERGSGTITVTVEPGAGAVRLIVADDGPGMTAEVKSRCMEPFFTTKTRGVSTGLGLSLVHGLVRQAGGDIEVQSEPGEGTTFTLTLPSASAPVGGPGGPRGLACLDIKDRRLSAVVAFELRALGYDVRTGTEDSHHAAVVITDQHRAHDGFRGKLVMLTDQENAPAHAVVLGARPKVEALRSAIRECSRTNA